METDKPRIDTVAQLAEKLAHLELALAQAVAPDRDPVVGLVLAPVDRVSVEPTDRVAEVQEISVAAIALAVGQVPAGWVAERARCR